MTERTLIQLESRYPDVLTAESEVKGLHYLYEAGLDRVAIAPSGGGAGLRFPGTGAAAQRQAGREDGP